MVVAVAVSLMLVGVLLAAGGVALEREEGVLARLLRGLVSRETLIWPRRCCWRPAARSRWRSRCSAGIGCVRRARLGAGRPVGGRARRRRRSPSRAVGVAIGVLAREVRAASLLALLVTLPLAFLALVPAGSVSERARHA